MKFPKLKTIIFTLFILFALFYLVGVYMVVSDDRKELPLATAPSLLITVAIFGASGTAGDGILEAALSSSDINKIHVITRRVTPRMEKGVATGKVQLSMHKDYLDYATVIERLADVDAVYWAIGINSLGVDEETYGMIHVDFPMQFVKAWSKVSTVNETSFHYLSSSDISEDSSAMWAREKIRAEKSLISFAKGSKMRVIAYRPDYIGPTKAEAHLGQDMLYWFFSPVGAAIRATQIGQVMIEVTARTSEFGNGDKLYTGKMLRFSDAYEARQ